jgi:hypothetical protein
MPNKLSCEEFILDANQRENGVNVFRVRCMENIMKQNLNQFLCCYVMCLQVCQALSSPLIYRMLACLFSSIFFPGPISTKCLAELNSQSIILYCPIRTPLVFELKSRSKNLGWCFQDYNVLKLHTTIIVYIPSQKSTQFCLGVLMY